MEPAGAVTVTLNAALDHSLECAHFRAGEVNRVSAHWQTPGGKGVNVAAFLSGWVKPVAAAGFLGRDNAAPFEALFRERGIEDRCVRVAGETRANLKVLDRERDAVTDLNLPGVRVGPSEWSALLAQVDALAHRQPLFVLAGSLPEGLPGDAYAQLVRRLRAAGCRVALDASGAPLRHGVRERPHLLKPNLRELEELVQRRLPDRAAVLAAARGLVADGVEQVVVSLGAEGALWVEARQALYARPPAPERLVSTVGAGDALLAGVLAGLALGEPAAAALRRGTAFAVGTLGCAGPVLPGHAELEALGARVQVEEVR
ncbi:1-phosphofructokinase [Aggregicoccus sp. 17bor-14]|uniref:1-phosphofructokinase n=1 Tax=Myxococcaceae TaxID=31 RepID=UPI00129C76E5|nr:MULTISPECIES: 1-phosphofructokinase [Myxococcaceae]MBF5043908.1 1-phosphofructokinase [Simulacricoccus sp. 17bor-14]MRI89659.1 1-phosphofructokinase [Aggregicoccus sp. 17bor-14]